MMIKRLTAITTTELDQIMQIWLQENIHAHGAYVGDEYWKENLPSVRSLIQTAEVYVSIADEKINGFCGLQEDYIAGVFVDSAFQSQGIGGQLLEHAKANREQLTLSVFEQNVQAVAFYKLHGFVVEKVGIDEDNDVSELEMSWHRDSNATND